jgi:hypothetical protein
MLSMLQRRLLKGVDGHPAAQENCGLTFSNERTTV